MGQKFSFEKDNWLSNLMKIPCYSLKIYGDIPNVLDSVLSDFHLQMNELVEQKSIFICGKVDTDNIKWVNFLENNGFRIIDTNLIFEKNISVKSNISDLEGIRFATLMDAIGICKIANKSFVYSRFHLDAYISNQLANKIKKQWVLNYFNGKRGDKMVVKIIDKKIVGFLQLLKNNKEKFVTIDLIAVDNDFQRQNIARDMISFAESFYQNYSKIFVGTQVANIPSVRLYEKLGFRLKKTKYILHYHGVK